MSETETLSPDLRVKLPIFEGPLDLLLYLIKKEEVDIYAVQLEKITDQYLGYLRLMKMLDLEVAGEFLVVASTLVYIKSRTLLPKDLQPPIDEEDEDDPRWDLIRQLVEYKKFKDAAWQLHLREVRQEGVFPLPARPELAEVVQAAEPGEDVGIFDLITALQKVLSRASQQEDLREIFEERFTVSDKINFIQGLMEQRVRVRFTDLFPEEVSRHEIVVTFLALLELIRMKVLRCVQSDTFGEIDITKGFGSLAGAADLRQEDRT